MNLDMTALGLPSMSILTWILALLPLVLVLILMFKFKISGTRAGIIAWVVTIIIAYIVFRAGPEVLTAGTIKGVWTTLSVLFIIWSSMFLYNIVNETGSFKVIANTFTKMTNGNKMLQLLLLGWVFPTFIQGVCGFGVPVAVATPLLIGLGFDPMLSVITALLGHSWGITFGSLGASYEALIANSDIITLANHRAHLAFWGSIFIAFGGIIVGFCILHNYHRYLSGKEKEDCFKRGLPAVLILSILMGVAMILTCIFVSPNLGCFIAGTVGLGAGSLILPKMNIYNGNNTDFKEAEGTPNFGFITAFSGYIILFIVVFTALLIPAFKDKLASIKFGYNAIETFTGYGFTRVAGFQSLNLTTPGFLILVSTIITIIFYKIKGILPAGAINRSLINTASQSIGSTTTVISMTMMATVMTESGMTQYIAYGIATVAGPIFPLLSPFIGLLGGFVTSSGTSSNVLFAGLQYSVADALNISPYIILAEQTTASSLSNSFSPGNVALGTGVSGQSGKEGDILKVTGMYNGIQSLLIGILGMIFVSLGLGIYR